MTTIDTNQLKLLDSQLADRELLAKLTLTARYILSGYYWGNGIPGGKTAEDFVTDAIIKTYESAYGKTGKGTRKWNPQKVTLHTHLEGAIRSDINHLASSLQNINHEEVMEEHALTAEISEQLISSEDSKYAEEFMNELQKEVNSDSNAAKVIKFIRDHDLEEKYYSNKVLSEGTGLSIRDIAVMKKRVTLKAKALEKKRG